MSTRPLKHQLLAQCWNWDCWTPIIHDILIQHFYIESIGRYSLELWFCPKTNNGAYWDKFNFSFMKNHKQGIIKHSSPYLRRISLEKRVIKKIHYIALFNEFFVSRFMAKNPFVFPHSFQLSRNPAFEISILTFLQIQIIISHLTNTSRQTNGSEAWCLLKVIP